MLRQSHIKCYDVVSHILSFYYNSINTSKFLSSFKLKDCTLICSSILHQLFAIKKIHDACFASLSLVCHFCVYAFFYSFRLLQIHDGCLSFASYNRSCICTSPVLTAICTMRSVCFSVVCVCGFFFVLFYFSLMSVVISVLPSKLTSKSCYGDHLSIEKGIRAHVTLPDWNKMKNKTHTQCKINKYCNKSVLYNWQQKHKTRCMF